MKKDKKKKGIIDQLNVMAKEADEIEAMNERLKRHQNTDKTMKRLMTIALLLLAGLAASAQGTWAVSHREADPMKNQDERDVYIYTVKGIGNVVVWDWDKAEFRLIAEKGFFRTLINSKGIRVALIRAGFYDESGKLEKYYDIQLVPEDNTSNKWISTAGFYFGGRGSIRKVMKRMKSGKGYVRLLGQLYDNKDFDINVTPYQPE